jgi:hypothetical protein
MSMRGPTAGLWIRHVDRLDPAGRAASVLYLAVGMLLMASLTYPGLLARPGWLVPMLWWALSIAAGGIVGRWALLAATPLPWLIVGIWYDAATYGWVVGGQTWFGGLIGSTILGVMGVGSGVLARQARPEGPPENRSRHLRPVV